MFFTTIKKAPRNYPPTIYQQFFSAMINNSKTVYSFVKMESSGKPTVPIGRQPHIDQKLTDPSSAFPKEEHYPIPSFFESRIKTTEFDLST